jgi:hypothetical protein
MDINKAYVIHPTSLPLPNKPALLSPSGDAAQRLGTAAGGRWPGAAAAGVGAALRGLARRGSADGGPPRSSCGGVRAVAGGGHLLLAELLRRSACCGESRAHRGWWRRWRAAPRRRHPRPGASTAGGRHWRICSSSVAAWFRVVRCPSCRARRGGSAPTTVMQIIQFMEAICFSSPIEMQSNKSNITKLEKTLVLTNWASCCGRHMSRRAWLQIHGG